MDFQSIVWLVLFLINPFTVSCYRTIFRWIFVPVVCKYCNKGHKSKTICRNSCPTFLKKKDLCSTQSYLCLPWTAYTLDLQLQNESNKRQDSEQLHSIKTLELFTVRDQLEDFKIIRYNKIFEKLRLQDMEGFCAAGIVPYYVDGISKQVYILVAKECRTNRPISTMSTSHKNNNNVNNIDNVVTETKYCFLGGKRDFIEETPWQTAKREFEEESRFFTDNDNFNIISQFIMNQSEKIPNNMYFISQAKYVLFGVKLPFMSYNSYDPSNLYYKPGPNIKEHTIVELTWLQVDKIVKEDFHSFAYGMLEGIQEVCPQFKYFFY